MGEAGKFFDPHDPDELAEILRSLADDESLRRELSKRGMERARTFSWGTTARGLLDVIEEIVPVGD